MAGFTEGAIKRAKPEPGRTNIYLLDETHIRALFQPYVDRNAWLRSYRQRAVEKETAYVPAQTIEPQYRLLSTRTQLRLNRIPPCVEAFFGREPELRLLDTIWFENSNTNVLALWF